MSNIQIDISDNGTVTLATAGKYCDRNIDINTSVNAVAGLEPTQFTNILKDENAVIIPNVRLGSTAGVNVDLNGSFVVEFVLPANTPKVFRFRGYVPFNSTVHYSKDNGSSWSLAYFNAIYSTIDEYGDTVWGTTMTTAALYYDILMRFNLHIVGQASAAALTEEGIRNSGAIMTINEPIGNIDPNQ